MDLSAERREDRGAVCLGEQGEDDGEEGERRTLMVLIV